MSELWAFTLQVYPRDGVQRAVIDLQDRHGADVNLLFLCCWAAASGRGVCERALLERADAAVDPWRRAVTHPLRALRDRLKGDSRLWDLQGAAEVRGKILAAEVESERVAQAVLEAAAPPPGPAGAAGSGQAEQSLRTYLEMLGAAPSQADRDAIAVLLRAAFPE